MSTRQWLDRRAIDDVGRSALRCAALGLADGTELSRLDDAKLKDHLAAALMARRLDTAVGAPVVLRALTQRTGRAAVAPAPAASSQRVAPVAPAPAAETTLGSDVDIDAMVAVLVKAARDGVPFCAECAKASAKRALEVAAG